MFEERFLNEVIEQSMNTIRWNTYYMPDKEKNDYTFNFIKNKIIYILDQEIINNSDIEAFNEIKNQYLEKEKKH